MWWDDVWSSKAGTLDVSLHWTLITDKWTRHYDLSQQLHIFYFQWNTKQITKKSKKIDNWTRHINLSQQSHILNFQGFLFLKHDVCTFFIQTSPILRNLVGVIVQFLASLKEEWHHIWHSVRSVFWLHAKEKQTGLVSICRENARYPVLRWWW